MVSNFDRILQEIRQEAHRASRTYGLDPEDVVKLIMEIVDMEDKNRIRAVAGINQKIKRMIEKTVQSSGSMEKSRCC